MIQKIKKYFSHEANVSKFVFSLVIIAVFSLVFGQAVYANFIGTAGTSTTFEYQYGYGDSGYGYGYGYGAGGDATYGHTESPTSDGAPTVGTPVPSQTSYTVSASTGYLAEVKLNSDAYETTFTSGSHTLSASGLTCNTAYSFTVYAKDVGGNTYPTSGTVTTSACSSGGGGGSSGGYVPPTPPTPIAPTGPTIISELQSQSKSLLLQLVALLQQKLNVLLKQRKTTGFMRDLAIGSRGEDVRVLQRYLNANGFQVSLSGPGSSGHETTSFGALTRAALARFQQTKRIFPAVGYFGPTTRAYIQTP